METIFEKDWKSSEPVVEDTRLASALIVPAKKVAKEVAKHIAIKPVLEQVIEKVVDPKEDNPFEPDEVAQTVREAFHEEVQGAVREALKDVMATAAQQETEKPAQKGKQG
jgi:hypothetical protein